MSKYAIEKNTLTGIADAVRELSYDKGTMTPAQIEAKIRDCRLGHPIDIITESHINPATGRWERPSEWPDLGSLTIGDDFDGVYLTYDLSKIDTPFLCVMVYLSSAGNYKIERGHISNGEFIIDATATHVQRSYYRETLDPLNGNYQVFRITPESNNIHITRFGFGPSESLDTSTCLMNIYQPCIERVGRLDYVTSFASATPSRTDQAYSTMWLEHDHVECAGQNVCTSLSATWRYAMSLQEIYVDWNTENWAVTTMQYMFSNCVMLENIIGIENWDTSNWTIKTSGLYGTFERCVKIKYLLIGNWDTSNWNPTSLRGMFSYCHNLRELDLSGWDTSSWAITEMYIMFMNCYSLVKLDFTGWNVSNWPITNIQYLFGSCYSLKKILGISNWDVSGWRPASIYQIFNNCRSLTELDLSQWDVSDWPITGSGINGAFGNCNSLKHLNISTWDVSDWRLTEINSVFSYDISLQEIDLSGWDVSEWSVTNISNIFGYCTSLKEVDLSDWDCSNWNVTKATSIFTYCYNLDTLILPTSLDLSKIDSTSDMFRNVTKLRILNRFNIPKSYNFSEAIAFTPTSLVNILNSLPTVSSATTITFSANNLRKITAADIAVATQKGWTVA